MRAYWLLPLLSLAACNQGPDTELAKREATPPPAGPIQAIKLVEAAPTASEPEPGPEAQAAPAGMAELNLAPATPASVTASLHATRELHLDAGALRAQIGTDDFGLQGSKAGRLIAPELAASPGERYAFNAPNGFLDVRQNPVSTFGLDVDTASYSNVRRFLTQGRLPPPAAVRVEELLNYFDYDYPAPPQGEALTVHHELARAPWSPERHLLKIALQAESAVNEQRPAANLVLLIDVSGSMADADKLPLLKESLKLMVRALKPNDRVGIVTYAGHAGVLLPSTSAGQAETIIQAIEQLQPGGSTAGASGIELAYQVAQQGYAPNGINRVLLATDGDFNVGISDVETLKTYVSERRASGIGLSTLGFGEGNYHDALMETLADNGNGSYGYIDSLAEGHKLLVQQLNGTLATVAGDAKLQVEFNPAVVKAYRLVGYENRGLRREDFSNDRVDAGDVGLGHNVTALYELELHTPAHAEEPLRYQAEAHEHAAPPPSTHAEELAYVRLRYKRHGHTESEERAWAIANQAQASIEQSTEAFRFATAVAGFGERLRGNPALQAWDWQAIRSLAAGAQGADREAHRRGFLELVELAMRLTAEPVAAYAPGLRYPRE